MFNLKKVIKCVNNGVNMDADFHTFPNESLESIFIILYLVCRFQTAGIPPSWARTVSGSCWACRSRNTSSSTPAVRSRSPTSPSTSSSAARRSTTSSTSSSPPCSCLSCRCSASTSRPSPARRSASTSPCCSRSSSSCSSGRSFSLRRRIRFLYWVYIRKSISNYHTSSYLSWLAGWVVHKHPEVSIK